MRKLMAIFLAACCMIFVSCGREKAFEGKVNTLDGVSMTVLQDTVTSRTMTLQILNTTDQEIYCGNDAVYELQAERWGKWYQVESGPYGYFLEAYVCQKNVPLEQYINLEKRYGALPAGRYRIIKEVSIGSGDTRQAFLLAAEFDMEERRK